MTITEPATLVTDYLLAAFTAALAWRLFRARSLDSRVGGPTSAWKLWWAVAFASTAAAGLAGGTVHGFQLLLAPGVLDLLWLLTLESLVVSSFAVARAAIAGAGLSEAAGRRLSLAAALAYAGYGLWLAGRPVFLAAIAAYGVALAVLVADQLRSKLRHRGARSLVAGVAVSVVAAAVQQSGWSLHRAFNHNDLYHVVQAVGVWLLYRGALAR